MNSVDIFVRYSILYDVNDSTETKEIELTLEFGIQNLEFQCAAVFVFDFMYSIATRFHARTSYVGFARDACFYHTPFTRLLRLAKLKKEM